MPKSGKGQTYRHTPAFILLFLARENLYGGALLHKMHNDLPGYRTDGAVIYRSLQELEQEGAVTSYWETDLPGPARKWYQITALGLHKLAGYKDDIEMRKKNFEYFLAAYGEITGQP
ncbi:MAG TPA: helix-turn-helix transcriptional regulator [Spirochaetia bacterium]|nr:helix-turn-helix transcriptional regulator [Spirochaetia bacterium]